MELNFIQSHRPGSMPPWLIGSGCPESDRTRDGPRCAGSAIHGDTGPSIDRSPNDPLVTSTVPFTGASPRHGVLVADELSGGASRHQASSLWPRSGDDCCDMENLFMSL